MRLFQNSGLYPSYLKRLRQLTLKSTDFASHISAFMDDRFGALHFLKPVLDQSPEVFFTNGDEAVAQRLWAVENGLPESSTLESILLAQIEHHGTEVFYNMDPMRFGNDFLKRLPACVRYRIAWRAAPSGQADFSGYDLLLCNFPSILQNYRERGWRAAYFSPAHDPEMDAYALNTNRPIDVLFVGGYSRHHRQRAQVLEAVAAQRKSINTVFHLDRSRLTRLAESTLGRWMPLQQHRRPANIVAVTAEPVFGRDLYAALSKAKIVLNGAVDMAGVDRGNMRCFEAMGCGSLMISDSGNYPKFMVDGETIRLYSNPIQAVQLIQDALSHPQKLSQISNQARIVLSQQYSKVRQWQNFCQLVEAI